MQPSCRLYLISPPRLDHPAIFAESLRASLGAGDVAAFLLRLPDADGAALAHAADTLRPLCQERDVAFLLNDHADLATKLDCDGIHLELGAMPYRDARRIVGSDRQIGVGCATSRDLAMTAGEAGADYVAFDASTEIVHWWSELFEVPCVAMGDITVESSRALVEAGADFLAVADGIWNHPDGPAEAVRAFNAIFSGDR